MDISGLPVIPIAAFFGAALLFLYELRQYTRSRKRHPKPSIPNFTNVHTPTPQELITNVALPSSSADQKKPKQKKRSYGVYYGVVGMLIIAIGVVAFSYFGTERITYVPRADEVDPLLATSPTIAQEDTTDPTATPLLVSTPTTSPSSSVTPTLIPAAQTPTPTSTPTVTPTPLPPSPTPTVISPTKALISPTSMLVARASTPTATIPTIARITPVTTRIIASPTPIPTSIPNSGPLWWPLVMVGAGGGLLLLGFLF